MAEREERLLIGVREARMRNLRVMRNRRRWRDAFAEFYGINLVDKDFLSPDEALALRITFYEKLKSGTSVETVGRPAVHRDALIADLRDCLQSFSQKKFWLLLGHHDEPDAVAVQPGVLLEGVDRIWNELRGEIALSSDQASSGICMGVDFFDITGAYVKLGFCSVSAWGDFRVVLAGL